MFETITWLVSNKCVLNCNYCQFRNRNIKEASLQEKIDALQVFKGWPDSDKRFICLLGGDVLCANGPIDGFLNVLNDLKLPYGWQTSGAPTEIMEAVYRNLKNLSISVDPPGGRDVARFSKAMLGLYWAGRLHERNKDIDIHATITMDRDNMYDVPTIVWMLSTLGIWVEITLVHWQKGTFDLVPNKGIAKGFKEMDKPVLEEVVRKLIKFKQAGGKIHSSEKFLKMIPEIGIDLDWKCPKPVNCVVDADMSMRCCLHLPGKRVRNWKLWDLKDRNRWEEFMKDWKADQDELCPKCAWDCQIEVSEDRNQNTVNDWFQHRG